MQIEKTDQWLLNGDCSLCRRDNYCSKPCTVHKRNFHKCVYHAVESAIDHATGGTFSYLKQYYDLQDKMLIKIRCSMTFVGQTLSDKIAAVSW